MAVSPDGRLVAAGGAEEPLVCVWDIKGGRARHRAPQAPRRADPGRPVLGRRPPPAHRQRGRGRRGRGLGPPGTHGRAAAGHPRAGPVAPHGRGDEPGRPRPDRRRPARRPCQRRRAVGARRRRPPASSGRSGGRSPPSPSRRAGSYLAAAGWEKLLYLWSTGPAPAALTIRARPQHDEKINAVAAWPGAPCSSPGATTPRCGSGRSTGPRARAAPGDPRRLAGLAGLGRLHRPTGSSTARPTGSSWSRGGWAATSPGWTSAMTSATSPT